MPLPLFIVGAISAAAAGAFGVGKSVKAGVDMHNAKETNERAQYIVERAKKEAEESRKNANQALEDLGNTKISVLTKSVKPFIETFEKIKNIELSESEGLKELSNLKSEDSLLNNLKDMSDMALKMLGGIAGGVAGGAALGAAAAFGAYSATMAFATASTGAAIAGLSGAAATNATLAFLGGGTLAAGGLGIAGGTALLGGVVAGPALAVLGFVVGAKASAAKDDAYSNLSTARKFEADMKAMRTACRGIRLRANMYERLLLKLDAIFTPIVYQLNDIVENSGTDYTCYTQNEKETVFASLTLAKAIKSVLDIPILNEDGSLTKESQIAPEEARKALENHAL